MSRRTLLPQGLGHAPALPTWYLQCPQEARLRGRETLEWGGGWRWGGPCLDLIPKVKVVAGIREQGHLASCLPPFRS